MKKFTFAILAVAALAMVSCGGNKQAAADSDSMIVNETAEVVEETVVADSETAVAVEEVATVKETPAKKPAAKKEEPAKPRVNTNVVKTGAAESAPAVTTQPTAQKTPAAAAGMQTAPVTEQGTGVNKRFKK